MENVILEDFVEDMRGKWVAVDKNRKTITYGEDAVKVHETALKNPDYCILIGVPKCDNFLYHNC